MKARKKCLRLCNMKKWAICLLFSFVLMSSLLPIKASSNSFNHLEITVELLDNGDAWITEIWDMTLNEGTELYKDESSLGLCEILDLSVVDENGNQFENIGTDWNINDSRLEKEYKCGINDENGAYELCFGVGEYGNRTYTIKYRMTNFVNAYSDVDGFNQRLVNDQMNPAPRSVQITIYKEGVALTYENAKIWAFGFDGDIQFVDGKVVANTFSSLYSSNYMNILMSINKGILNPENSYAASFEELKDEAFIGSDYIKDEGNGNSSYIPDYIYDDIYYDSGPDLFDIIGGLFFIIVFFIIIFFAVIGSSRSKSSLHYQGLLVDEDKIDYYRQLPVDGSLEATYYLLDYLKKLDNDTDIMGAYLLKWVQQGNIRMEERERKRFFGLSTSLEPSIIFVNREGIISDLEHELYDVLEDASGHEDILQEFELKSWSEKHYTRLESWMDRIKHRGKREVLNNRGLEEVQTTSFFGLIKSTAIVLSEKGKQFAFQILGFKNYLKDYTLIHEREVYEVGLWGEYLIFAALYGIADKVAESFKNLYPKFFEEQFYRGTYYQHMDLYYTMRFVRRMSQASHTGIANAHVAQSASSIAGAGGGASFGGGGGFSGGGSGGGVR